jgi:hypothetical protein
MSSESAHLSQNLPKKQPQNEAIKRYAKNKMRKQTNAMSSPSRHPIPKPKAAIPRKQRSKIQEWR